MCVSVGETQERERNWLWNVSVDKNIYMFHPCVCVSGWVLAGGKDGGTVARKSSGTDAGDLHSIFLG